MSKSYKNDKITCNLTALDVVEIIEILFSDENQSDGDMHAGCQLFLLEIMKEKSGVSLLCFLKMPQTTRDKLIDIVLRRTNIEGGMPTISKGSFEDSRHLDHVVEVLRFFLASPLSRIIPTKEEELNQD